MFFFWGEAITAVSLTASCHLTCHIITSMKVSTIYLFIAFQPPSVAFFEQSWKEQVQRACELNLLHCCMRVQITWHTCFSFYCIFPIIFQTGYCKAPLKKENNPWQKLSISLYSIIYMLRVQITKHTSLSNGVIPSCFKQDIAKPLLKKKITLDPNDLQTLSTSLSSIIYSLEKCLELALVIIILGFSFFSQHHP